MKKDFTVTIKGTVVTDDQYDKLIEDNTYADWGIYIYTELKDKEDKDIHLYFSKYRYNDYEYKITRQVGINAWNTIFNSKSCFVTRAISKKKSYTKAMKYHKNIDPDSNRKEDNTASDSEIKRMAQVASETCKEEISVYRDYLKTCAKVLKAIIDHGGDSKYKKNENNDDEYLEEA